MNEKIEKLEQIIGYSFQDKMLVKRALTHTSFSNEQKINKNGDYERLEFLGDAVLELLSSEHIYLTNEKMGEGAMTKLRAAIVCEPSLAQCAKEIELSEFILLGKGESAMGGRKRDSIVSDVLEALIGALYLDGGMEVAKNFVHKYVLNDIEHKQLIYDAKSSLQELVQKEKKGQIQYLLLSESGPEHEKEFSCAVLIDGKQMGMGIGRNKKEAEQKAAAEALFLMKK
jgi:ribonuclease-3